MNLKIDKKIIDFERLIPMGQFFNYFEMNGVYYIVSANEICGIQIMDTYSVITADNIMFWKHYFDLNTSYKDINSYLKKHCKKTNDVYGLECLEKAEGLTLCRQPFFETSIEYLMSSMNTVKNIRSFIRRLCECYGELWHSESLNIDYRGFPAIEILKNLSVKDFEDLKAGFRGVNIYNFIHNYKELDDSMDYEYIISVLRSYKGIGPKVASCIALYSLYQTDAFPIDVWIQRVLDTKYTKENPFIMPNKYAGILQVYMFQNIRN